MPIRVKINCEDDYEGDYEDDKFMSVENDRHAKNKSTSGSVSSAPQPLVQTALDGKLKTTNATQSALPGTGAAAMAATNCDKPFDLCIDLGSLPQLERLDNLRLDLQRTAPLGYRAILTRETVAEYLIDFLLDDYDDGAGTNGVITRFKDELADIKDDADSDG